MKGKSGSLVVKRLIAAVVAVAMTLSMGAGAAFASVATNPQETGEAASVQNDNPKDASSKNGETISEEAPQEANSADDAFDSSSATSGNLSASSVDEMIPFEGVEVVDAEEGNLEVQSSVSYRVPVDQNGKLCVTGEYGEYYNGVKHNGIDIAPFNSYASQSFNVYASAAGRVVRSEYHSSWGNYVKVKHDDGCYTLYAHLSSRSVSSGQSVSQGQTVGVMGATGDASGKHVHFEYYKGGEASSYRTNPRQIITVPNKNVGITTSNSSGGSSAYSAHNPEGYLDVATGGDGTVTVRGWAFDRDNINANLSIHIYVGGMAGSGAPGYGWVVANQSRSDVNKAYGISGNHGFEATIKTDQRGTQNIYAYAINTGGGSGNTLLTNSPRSTTILEPAGSAVKVDEGTYAIRSKMDTSMGLDVASASKDENANVWLWKWNSNQSSGSTCEKFQIKSAGDGSYYIIATHSNKAVEVWGAKTESGANVSQHTQNQSVAQRWFFDKNSDGTFTIRQRNSGQVMDVQGAKTDNGTNIMQHPSNGGNNQKFYLVPTDASKWDVALSSTSMKYTGKALTPTVTVKAGGVTMKEGTDYTVSYKNNTKAGAATATVTAKGGLSGSKDVAFTITSASSGQNNSSGNKSSDSSKVSMYRLYNPNSGEHFYTADAAERDNLDDLGWNYEGVGWTAPETSYTPVYRLYNEYGGEHHYTMDSDECNMLIDAGWNYEGIGWHSDDAKTVPLYRDYNPNAFANNHNYTADWSEHVMLQQVGWQYENIAWYGV